MPRGFMKVKAVWQFFEAERDGNSIHLFDAGRDAAAAHLPLRTAAARKRPVPERLHSAAEDGRRDHLAFFVVHGGRGHSRTDRSAESERRILQGARHCRRWRSRPRKAAPSGCIAAFAKTGAFPIRPTMTMQERFTSRYRGKRYSFGYPACPNLDDQQGLWKLLRPEDIGVRADRRHDDGAGSQRQRAGVPPSRLRVLHGGRIGAGRSFCASGGIQVKATRRDIE